MASRFDVDYFVIPMRNEIIFIPMYEPKRMNAKTRTNITTTRAQDKFQQKHHQQKRKSVTRLPIQQPRSNQAGFQGRNCARKA